MVRQKVQDILSTLSFSGERDHFRARLSGGSMREWQHVMEWLDSSGLALYFLRRLEEDGMQGAVPAHVLYQLKERWQKNLQRMAAIGSTFDSLNRRFSRAGIHHVVLKGFSLVPEYCPDESLRAQGDLDYLVHPDFLDAASRILTEQGYVLKKRAGQQYIFWIPSKEPVSSAEQYDVTMPCAIELHVALWDEGRFLVPLRVPQALSGLAKMRRWRGYSFPALTEPQIFFHQTLHIFQHVVTGSVRLCHFFEIAYFMNQTNGMTSFWSDIERSLCCEPTFRDIVGLVSAMALTVFPGSRAAIIARCSAELSPVVRLWIETYSRTWLIEGGGEAIRFFSSGKLVLFLREQYISPAQQAGARTRSLVPLSKLLKLLKPRIFVAKAWTRNPDRSRLLSRILYHIGSNFRYLYEIPRWSRSSSMLRTRVR